MQNDLPEHVIQETDAVVQRILEEWPWLEGADDQRKIELRDLQNKVLELRELFVLVKKDEHQSIPEIQENILVLTKKIKQKTAELLQSLRISAPSSL